LRLRMSAGDVQVTINGMPPANLSPEIAKSKTSVLPRAPDKDVIACDGELDTKAPANSPPINISTDTAR
jgi:hypothetical protein